MASSTKSYLIPLSDLNLSERQEIRSTVNTKLDEVAMRLAIRDNVNDLVIRETLPNVDLGLAAQDDWLIAGAGAIGVLLQYIGFLLPVDRCLAFWGVGVESAAASVSRVNLSQGAGSAQVRGVFQIEQLQSRLEPAGYFSEPVIFSRQEFIRVQVMPRLAFAVNSERLHFFARTIEPIGNTISSPSV